jgi:hypothetical protein
MALNSSSHMIYSLQFPLHLLYSFVQWFSKWCTGTQSGPWGKKNMIKHENLFKHLSLQICYFLIIIPLYIHYIIWCSPKHIFRWGSVAIYVINLGKCLRTTGLVTQLTRKRITCLWCQNNRYSDWNPGGFL